METFEKKTKINTLLTTRARQAIATAAARDVMALAGRTAAGTLPPSSRVCSCRLVFCTFVWFRFFLFILVFPFCCSCCAFVAL
jgi:hypothetical protein